MSNNRCKHGHLKENPLWWKDENGKLKVKCRECHRLRMRRYRAKIRQILKLVGNVTFDKNGKITSGTL